MKRLFLITGLALLGINTFNQVPDKIRYQAVVRDADNNLIINGTIGMRVSIIQGSIDGSPVYSETHSASSNQNGLITIEIGGGSSSDDFTTIDWSDGPFFIKTEIDPLGGSDYTIIGTSQLLSVPYAFYAGTAGEVAGGISETDPLFGTSVASGITESDTARWNANTETFVESDPVFSQSVASGINEEDTSNWNNKLDMYTETDPLYGSSVAAGITVADTTNWNNKLDGFTESQNLADVIEINNSANNSNITNLANPVNEQDAATKSYVTLRVSTSGDTLFLGTEQWVIIPGISAANSGESEIITDIDGNTYDVIKIGTQDWLAENLKTTRYNDGTSIPLVTDAGTWWGLMTPAYCWYNNDSASYAQTYGALYNWYTVETGKLCPAGWHVPMESEWTLLINYLLGESVAGGKLKEIGTTIWNAPNTGATNESGFTALPGGYREYNGVFSNIGYHSYWWSATEDSGSSARYYLVTYDSSTIITSVRVMILGLSIRCLRD